jgi:hypothetical protein
MVMVICECQHVKQQLLKLKTYKCKKTRRMYRKHGQLNMFHKGNKKKLTIVRFDYPCVNKNLTRIYISTKPQINYPILKLYQCCLSGGGATCRKITVHIQKEKTETQLSWTEEYVA